MEITSETARAENATRGPDSHAEPDAVGGFDEGPRPICLVVRDRIHFLANKYHLDAEVWTTTQSGQACGLL